jgi:hypothetical protein
VAGERYESTIRAELGAACVLFTVQWHTLPVTGSNKQLQIQILLHLLPSRYANRWQRTQLRWRA